MNSRPCRVEPLEPRTLLASVEGFYFKDRFIPDFFGPNLDRPANGLRDADTDIGILFKNGSTPRVQLFDAGPNQRLGGGDDTLVAQVNTFNNGFYRFNSVPSGFYIVRFRDLPQGFRFQTPDLDFDDPTEEPSDHFDSDANGNGQTQAFFLGPDTLGEASAAIVSNKTPGAIVAVFKGFHADSPNNGSGPISNGIDFGNLKTGQNRTRTVRWYNTGGKPITIESARAGFDLETNVNQRTGRFWEFVTDLTDVTIQPGKFIDVVIRYGTGVPGAFGDPGSFVVGGRRLTGPINVTAQDVQGIGAAIRNPLKSPKNREKFFSFDVLYASNPNEPNPDTVTSGDVIVTGKGGFQASATRRTECEPNTLDFIAATNCEVIFRIDARGGRWDPADNGTYQVRHLRNAAFDNQGNPVPGRLLSTFKVKI